MFEASNGILSSFEELTQEEMRLLIQDSSKKSCMLDPLLISLVVNSLEELLPVITIMVNTSLSIDRFSFICKLPISMFTQTCERCKLELALLL